MKSIFPFLLVGFLTACGGSDSGSGEQQQEQEPELAACVPNGNTLTLESGESCEVSDAVAAAVGVAAGTVICDNGVINYNGIAAGSGSLTFGSFTLICNVASAT